MSTPTPSSTVARPRSQINLRTALLIYAVTEFVVLALFLYLILVRR